MPRGPGKKENYNFDYSRFNDADDIIKENEAKEADVPLEVFNKLPGELKEAFRLMQIARQTGDDRAQERANELALQAVNRGGPEMQQKFQEELMRQAEQNPDAKAGIESLLNFPAGGGAPGKGKKDPESTLEGLSSTINSLTLEMQKGRERTRQQLEAMEKQQQLLEQLRGPEDFARFMDEQGVTQEDLQRALGGDEEHMKKMVDRSLEKIAPPHAKTHADAMDQVLDAVDSLHGTLTDQPQKPAQEKSAKVDNEMVAHPRKKTEPKIQMVIPEHRVQYQKDESGRLQQVELRCQLPGVESMNAIEVDVSENHLRLRTSSPAYVVNVGPFPAFVDASAAKAKFSKKRQELTLTVPSKP